MRTVSTALIRFTVAPPIGAWETLASFHGLFKRQWHVLAKVVSTDGPYCQVSLESDDAPTLRGDEAIQILSGDYHGCIQIGAGTILSVSDKDHQTVVLGHFRNLSDAEAHLTRCNSTERYTNLKIVVGAYSAYRVIGTQTDSADQD